MGAMLPRGVSEDVVLEELSAFTENDVDWHTGKVLTGLYDPGPNAHRLAVEAYNRFLPQNALYVNMYPSIGRLEREVIQSVAELLQADDNAVGNFTSGGTESILMAVKTARDWARVNRPEIKNPEMVLPVTAHPAFLKAAHYFGIRVTQTAVNTNDFRANLAAYKKALGPDTVIAVGSAPNFSHGSVDPIPEMAALAKERNILFHVDGCVGGIYLSIMRRMDKPVPAFDFSLPGVTSISVDLHKYGYTPKNASLILYHNRDLRRYAWFVSSSTTEYLVINPTTQSSRTGGPIAAAWAVLRYLGEEGFQNIVSRSQKATQMALEAITAIDGIRVLGEPDMCMFTIASDDLNVFEIDDQLRRRGWHLVPQFACGGSPPNLHISMSEANVPHIDQFIADLRAVTAELLRNGLSVNREEMALLAKKISGRPVEEVMIEIVSAIGLTGMDLPQQMAPLNTLLDMLPAGQRDELITVFFNMTA